MNDLTIENPNAAVAALWLELLRRIPILSNLLCGFRYLDFPIDYQSDLVTTFLFRSVGMAVAQFDLLENAAF